MALADPATDAVLVAEVSQRVVGMPARSHVTPSFNEARSRARITALIVDPGLLRSGIGRHLLTAVEAAAKRRGCGAVELTSSPYRRGAHRFYPAAGYQDLPHRFLKPFDPQPSITGRGGAEQWLTRGAARPSGTPTRNA